MSRFRRPLIVAAILLLAVYGTGLNARDSNQDARKEIKAFNQKFLDLHLKMDTPGIMAMWAEDGVDLMQGEDPIIGRKTIQAWVENVLAKMPRYKVTKEEMVFHDIRVCGSWATEWATEHQVAKAPEGKPDFDGHGKMALVLHRELSGEWKIQQEMWNVSPKPAEAVNKNRNARDCALKSCERYSSWKCQRVTASVKFSACSS